jgi:integrase/recombinase XerD
MPSTVQLDACGRRRSPATLSSFHRGLSPRNKVRRYPADPPTVEEIIAVMHAAGEDNEAVRLRGLIVSRSLSFRASASLFCVLHGPTVGRAWAPAGVRSQLHHAAARAGVRRRVAPHQLRHAHAVEMSRECVPLLVIQRQLGHADLAITSVYLRGIDNTETVHAVHERPAPVIPATHGL